MFTHGTPARGRLSVARGRAASPPRPQARLALSGGGAGSGGGGFQTIARPVRRGGQRLCSGRRRDTGDAAGGALAPRTRRRRCGAALAAPGRQKVRCGRLRPRGTRMRRCPSCTDRRRRPTAPVCDAGLRRCRRRRSVSRRAPLAEAAARRPCSRRRGRATATTLRNVHEWPPGRRGRRRELTGSVASWYGTSTPALAQRGDALAAARAATT